MLLSVISEILGLFVNTMTADDEYSVPNSEKLPQPIQMQLSKKEKCFGQFFATCLKTISNFQNVQKKYDPHS